MLFYDLATVALLKPFAGFRFAISFFLYFFVGRECNCTGLPLSLGRRRPPNRPGRELGPVRRQVCGAGAQPHPELAPALGAFSAMAGE